jgi:small subunit ribosomal protein S17
MTQKEQIGFVISNKSKKTINVIVQRRYTDFKYRKVLIKSKSYMVNDPQEEAKIGDLVLIQNCRPISHRKSWKLIKIFNQF